MNDWPVGTRGEVLVQWDEDDWSRSWEHPSGLQRLPPTDTEETP